VWRGRRRNHHLLRPGENDRQLARNCTATDRDLCLVCNACGCPLLRVSAAKSPSHCALLYRHQGPGARNRCNHRTDCRLCACVGVSTRFHCRLWFTLPIACKIDVPVPERILSVDTASAKLWGEWSAQRSRPVVDTLLAATAVVHGLVLVTRNENDIQDLPVKVLNPWRSNS
jgi:hypothetical protein